MRAMAKAERNSRTVRRDHRSQRELRKGAKPGELNLSDLGSRIHDERLRRGMSLNELCQHSGVSRSMISAIERGTKAPTILILDRLATALGTSLSRLLVQESRARIILIPRDKQKVVIDSSGWERRVLSPVLPGIEFEFMRTVLNPGVDAGAFLPHAGGSREYVAVERGVLSLTIDGNPHTLRAGDSIYYEGDCVHAFANPGRTPCLYYLAMDVSGHPAKNEHRSVTVAEAGSGHRERTGRYDG
ncbi:MAG TPA: XRE family transcriptional regulator [Blastocatellia bacterium]|nr:XRE family transcriptional regulator [Blastocatellia bacterium]